MKYLYAKVTALLAVITLLSVGITCLTATVRPVSDNKRIVTSFYPVYIAALNVVGDTDGVEVVNLVNQQTGCLHDYQMSPSDRVTLDSADLLIENGADAEPFLNGVLETMPQLTVVDLSKGQTLIANEPEEHEEHGQAAEHDHGAYNSHLWVSPPRYRQEIETLRDGLTAYDPAHAQAYADNAAAYIEKIDGVWQRMQTAAAALNGADVMLFHDSLVYLAEDLGLHVVASLDVGEESGVSAADLSAAEDALRGCARAVFLYDAQYDAVQYAYLQQIPAQVTTLTIDTGVSGNGDADSWLRSMEALLTALEEVAV